MCTSKLSKYCLAVLVTLFFSCGGSNNPTTPQQPDSNPNAVLDIVIDGSSVWLGAASGLMQSQDGGLTWRLYEQSDGLPRGSISALNVDGNEIWVAGGYDSLDFQVGGGLSYSSDYGASWKFISQPGPTPISNITFDIAIQNNVVWIASFGGGLRKSIDMGESWEIVTPDTADFDPVQNLNHRAFSLFAAENELWVGTAAGINKSEDSGQHWENFNHENNTVSGNFVVALNKGIFNGEGMVWAATRKALGENEFDAISRSDNTGSNWQADLHFVKIHNIAISDSGVFAASAEGVFRYSNKVMSWELYNNIQDKEKNLSFSENEFFAVYNVPEADNKNFGIWIGGNEGLAHSLDDGNTWSIIKLNSSSTNKVNLKYNFQHLGY